MARAKQVVQAPLADTSAAAPIGSNATLRDTVKQALLKILEDGDASAAAKASAGRTLLDYFDERDNAREGKRGADMSLADIDAELSRG